MKIITRILGLMGIEDATTFKYILVKHIGGEDIYFMETVDGVPDFTMIKARAWKFKTRHEAIRCKAVLGVFYRGMSIVEIQNKNVMKKEDLKTLASFSIAVVMALCVIGVVVWVALKSF